MPMAQRTPTTTPTPLLGSLGFFLLIVALLALRNHDAIRLPILGHEDGRDIFAFYLQHDHPGAILRSYSGYVSLLPNALGWVALRLPLPAAPHAITWAALLMAALGFFGLSRPGHAWLVPDTGARRAVALALVLLPLGKGYLLTNLMYSQWSLLFLLLVLLTRWPLPSSMGALWTSVAAIALCAASHPLSILALPLVGLQLLLDERPMQRLAMLTAAALMLGYQLLWVDHTATAVPALEATLRAVKLFLGRVCFESVAGAHATTSLLAGSAGFVAYLGGLGLLAALGAALWWSDHRRRDAGIVVGALSLAFAIVLVSALFKNFGPQTDAIFLEDPRLQRYLYVPKLIVLTLLLGRLAPWLRRIPSRGNELLLGALALAGALYLLAVHTDNAALYYQSEAEGRRVRDFVHALHLDQQRAARGEPHQAQHRLERPGDWSITVTIPER